MGLYLTGGSNPPLSAILNPLKNNGLSNANPKTRPAWFSPCSAFLRQDFHRIEHQWATAPVSVLPAPKQAPNLRRRITGGLILPPQGAGRNPELALRHGDLTQPPVSS